MTAATGHRLQCPCGSPRITPRASESEGEVVYVCEDCAASSDTLAALERGPRDDAAGRWDGRRE